MIRTFALATVLALAGCGASSAKSDAQPTQAPAAIFKDALLMAAVKAKLTAEDIDSTTRVRVGVHDGRVTLAGRVPTDDIRKRTVAVAASVKGVTGVDDELGVGNAGPSTAQAAGDLALEAAVESALVAQTGVNVTAVHVSAANGTVTVRGKVATAAVKATMLDAVKGTPGVRNVVDRIAVK